MKKLYFCLFLVLLVFSLLANGVLIKNGVSGQYLNLLSCNVETVINNQVATTVATMRFYNNFSTGTSTVFSFPHPPEASPTALSWYVNNTWHDAVISPGAGGPVVPPGEYMYPALDNYLGKTYLAFPVAEQVLSGHEMIFRVTYVQLLPYLNGRVDYDFNSCYGYLSNPPLDSLSVSIQINGNRGISNVELPGFDNVNIDIDGNTATVNMISLGFIPDQDIELSYMLAMENLGASTFSTMIGHQYVPDELGDGFFMSIVEPQPSANVIQKYFTFMLDHSQMMNDTSMQQAKDAASYMIGNLNPGDYFNIVDFATVAGTFAVNHVPYNSANRDLALSYIANLQPGGSCNISGAFDMAIPQFAGSPDEAAHVIVFLTIGHPTAGIVDSNTMVSHIDNLVATTGRDVNIFCFGVGTSVAFQLLSRISAAHHGIATYVGLNQLLDVLVDFYTKIRNPILLDPEIEVIGQTGNIGETYPDPLPNLYLGNQMILCGRYHQAANLSFDIDGYVLGSPVNYHYEHQLNQNTDTAMQFVMKIWAKLKIEYLMTLYYQLNPSSMEAIALHNEIVQISIDYGVLCSFTSFTGGEVSNPDDLNPSAVNPLQITSCAPNPFMSQMELRVKLYESKAPFITLSVYNIRGQLIRTITLPAGKSGEYSFNWDGLDDMGRAVSSGIYLCRVSIPGYSRTTKVILVK